MPKRFVYMISLLAKTRIFNDLDRRTLQMVANQAHRKQIATGGFFFHQGEPALAVYVLARGHAKILQVTLDGHQVLIRYIGSGQEFGLVAVLDGFDYPASVQTVEACEALVWPGEVLAQLMERHSRIGFNALRILAQQNQDLQQRYHELLTEHVEQRLAQTILRLAKQAGSSTTDGTLIELPLSREDLAELVGTDMYSVSRLMSRWEERGFVHTDHQHVLLLRPDALTRLAMAD